VILGARPGERESSVEDRRNRLAVANQLRGLQAIAGGHAPGRLRLGLLALAGALGALLVVFLGAPVRAVSAGQKLSRLDAGAAMQVLDHLNHVAGRAARAAKKEALAWVDDEAIFLGAAERTCRRHLAATAALELGPEPLGDADHIDVLGL